MRKIENTSMRLIISNMHAKYIEDIKYIKYIEYNENTSIHI